MRLIKIKLAGFKSFVDPLTIHFPSNLIGIVGPNGCGKSNVIDAVRWVMGETSAKQLRGDSMADVIFNGSTGRKPVGQAQIELVFDNSDGKVGGEFARYNEISIKRQVTRDGQSSYFLNGTRCRRRDITDVFLGTGLGPRSYAIIEQGMISRLIEARPEELRIFLEEAAGISRYKERRKETESRIRATRENIERLNDLIDEIGKQLSHLQRQAKAAEKYKEFKQEERQVKAELLALRWRGLDQVAGERERIISEHQTRLEGIIAEQRAFEADLEKQRTTHHEAGEAFNQVQARYYSVGAEIARLEQSIQHARDTRQRHEQDLAQAEAAWAELNHHIEQDTQRVSALAGELEELMPAFEAAQTASNEVSAELAQTEQAMHDWQQAWDEFNRRAAEPAQNSGVERTRIDQLERHQAQLAQRRTRIDSDLQNLALQTLGNEVDALVGERSSLQEQVDRRQQELDILLKDITVQREANNRLATDLDEAREQLQEGRGRLVSLEALQQASLGKNSDAVTAWLAGQALAEAPRLGQQLDVEKGWERAVETVLGTYLEAVCVPGLDAVAGALSDLSHGALLLLDSTAADATATGSLATPLSAHVSSKQPLGDLLSGVYCAENLNDALALRDRLGAHESVVTADGVWVGRGWLRVARDDDKQGVISREKEINELKKIVETYSRDAASLSERLEQGQEALDELEQRRERAQEAVNQQHRRYAETQSQWSAKRARLEELQSRETALRGEIDEIAAQARGDEDEVHAARQRLSVALAAMETLATEREQLIEQRDRWRKALDDVRPRARVRREEAHELALRVETLRTTSSAVQEGLQRMQQQLSGLEQRRVQLRDDLAAAESPIEGLTADLEARLGGRLEVEGELNKARALLESIDETVRELEQRRGDCEQRAEAMRGELEQERLAGQEIKVRRQTLKEQLDETGYTLENLFEALPPEAEEGVWHDRVTQLELKIQRLGAINLAAIEEYAEQSKRKEYLDAQHADLTEALQTLEDAIRKIDRETRTRFKETFDKVNSGLQAMFPRLFGGGHAYLELTGEDLLDTGVAVMARPPGKRISTIHLMSGGEKALTAVALVFSIFELNPSPFCMLDEVDAPLDDANVSRFCDLVREMSERVQFIFITHNKVTMEMANQLTGVTMHEAGVSRLVAVDVDEAVQLATA